MQKTRRYPKMFRQLFTLGLSACLFFFVTASPGFAQAEKETKKEAAAVRALIKTSLGNIVLELDKAKAPITVQNFLNYTDKGFYDGTIFHRVIANFMIQGGGFTPDMQQKETDPPIENEWKNGLSNVLGSVAMARLGGQANSATSQFFINVKDNSFLDQPRDGAGYAVFGKVVEGTEVVDKIKNVKTTTVGMFRDVPAEPVIIEKVVLLNEKGEAMPRTADKKTDDTKK